MSARQSGNTIHIGIMDDGRGIDADKLAAKAIASGTHTAEQVAAMTREEKIELIYEAGLSTAEKNDLPDREFAFEDARKEPLTDAEHVRNAIARFDQVQDVTDAERDRAWKRIERAAERYDIEVESNGDPAATRQTLLRLVGGQFSAASAPPP